MWLGPMVAWCWRVYTHTYIYIWCIYTVYRNKEPFKANYQLWRLPFFLAGITLCFTSVVSSEKSFFYCISFLSFPSVSLFFSICLITGFLKPQCSLAPPMQRGRSGEACSCFSGMCPLHQRRLSSGNSWLCKQTCCCLVTCRFLGNISWWTCR